MTATPRLIERLRRVMRARSSKRRGASSWPEEAPAAAWPNDGRAVAQREHVEYDGRFRCPHFGQSIMLLASEMRVERPSLPLSARLFLEYRPGAQILQRHL